MIKIVLISVMLGATLIAVAGIAYRTSRETGNETRTERVGIVPTAVPTPDSNRMMRGNLEEEILLVVDKPIDSTEIIGTQVSVAGRTVPGADVAVNDLDIKADSKGNFRVMLEVDEGENLIVVVANDETGREAEREITIGVIYPEK